MENAKLDSLIMSPAQLQAELWRCERRGYRTIRFRMINLRQGSDRMHANQGILVGG